MRTPLRIACIGTRGIPSHYSGIERACESLYAELARRGHDITVYGRPEHVGNSPRLYRGIRVVATPSLRTPSLETLSSAAASLIEAIAGARYDILHLHALAPNLFAGLCRAAGMTTVATVHGLDWQRAKWKGLGARVLRSAEASMVRYADRIIVVSRDLQRHYAESYGRDTAYIPNGIETVDSALARSEVLRRFGLTARDYILYLGRLVPEKRIEDLIQAYEGFSVCGRLVIAGDTACGSTYVKRLSRLAGGDERVLFTGLLEGPDVHALLANAAAYVSPSALEGLPMSLLECIQQGTPAVVSDIPPHRELLGGIAGYDLFATPGNVRELQDKIRMAVARQSDYRQMVIEARRSMSEMHAWSAIAERTEMVMYQALANTARCRRRGANGMAGPITESGGEHV